VLALVVQAAGVLGTFVGYEILGDLLGTGNHFGSLQVDAVATVVTALAAIWGRNLGHGAAARVATGPISAIAQRGAATNFIEIVLWAANPVSTGAISTVAGVRGRTGSAFTKAAVKAAFLICAIWLTFALIGIAVEGSLTLGAKPAASVLSALLAGARWLTNAETALADLLSTLALATATAAPIGTTAILLTLRLADLYRYFRDPAVRIGTD
jgi:hypothetical protein